MQKHSRLVLPSFLPSFLVGDGEHSRRVKVHLAFFSIRRRSNRPSIVFLAIGIHWQQSPPLSLYEREVARQNCSFDPRGLIGGASWLFTVRIIESDVRYIIDSFSN